MAYRKGGPARAIFDFFLSAQPRRTRANCPYCRGVKCMGACGNNPDEYADVSICGVVRRPTEHIGVIECAAEGKVFDFEANSEVGREILSACPPGSRCRIEGRHREGSLKSIAYIERLNAPD